MTITRKTITLYPNNKPWVSKSLKSFLNRKKIAYYQGDIIEQREAQKLVRNEITLAKMQYKNKVQDELRSGDSRYARKGIKYGGNPGQEECLMLTNLTLPWRKN